MYYTHMYLLTTPYIPRSTYERTPLEILLSNKKNKPEACIAHKVLVGSLDGIENPTLLFSGSHT